MSDLATKAAEAKAKMESSNPSVSPAKTAAERVRIPISVPQRKLEVPPIPGYYTKWFRGTPHRLAQAERAGFVFVDQSEVQLNEVSLGGDARKDGNTDMGSRVSVIEGGEVDSGGQAMRLYLMKQKWEHYLEDRGISQKRNEDIADTLTAAYRTGQVGGTAQGEQPVDVAARYVDPRRTRIPDLFRKKGSGAK